MKKILKESDGKYHIKGHVYDELIGSRAKVCIELRIKLNMD